MFWFFKEWTSLNDDKSNIKNRTYRNILIRKTINSVLLFLHNIT